MIKLSLNIAALSVALLFSALQAQALSTRTWVSPQGNDANAGKLGCSHEDPCRTFTAALTQTTPGGEINVIDSGDFGTLTIDRAVVIDAGGHYAGIIVQPGGTGITINVSSQAQVILRGLSINGVHAPGSQVGGATGIKFNSGQALYVESCRVANLSDIGIYFTTTNNPAFLFVKDTEVRNCFGAGIQVESNGLSSNRARASIDKTRLEGVNVGVRAHNNSYVVVRDSVASSNGTAGFFAFAPSLGASAFLSLENCVASHNVVGVLASFTNTGTSQIIISNVTLYGNTKGLQTTGQTPFAQIISFGNNKNGDNGTPNGVQPPQ
jgi:hypothetical protein